jgi:hypothetical protein
VTDYTRVLLLMIRTSVTVELVYRALASLISHNLAKERRKTACSDDSNVQTHYSALLQASCPGAAQPICSPLTSCPRSSWRQNKSRFPVPPVTLVGARCNLGAPCNLVASEKLFSSSGRVLLTSATVWQLKMRR